MINRDLDFTPARLANADYDERRFHSGILPSQQKAPPDWRGLLGIGLNRLREFRGNPQFVEGRNQAADIVELEIEQQRQTERETTKSSVDFLEK